MQVLFGYMALYSLNVMGIQSWYSAHIFVPLLVLGMLVVQAFQELPTKLPRVVLHAGLLILIAFNMLMFSISPATYHDQAGMRDVGIQIRELRERGVLTSPVAFSDAGIIGFYSGGHIVNTDGLVNREIAWYFPDRLPCFLYEKKLQFVSSFGWIAENMGTPIPWQEFSELRKFRTNNGTDLLLREVDYKKINKIYGCTSKSGYFM